MTKAQARCRRKIAEIDEIINRHSDEMVLGVLNAARAVWFKNLIYLQLLEFDRDVL